MTNLPQPPAGGFCTQARRFPSGRCKAPWPLSLQGEMPAHCSGIFSFTCFHTVGLSWWV